MNRQDRRRAGIRGGAGSVVPECIHDGAPLWVGSLADAIAENEAHPLQDLGPVLLDAASVMSTASYITVCMACGCVLPLGVRHSA